MAPCRVALTQFVDKPIDVGEGWRRRGSPGRMCLNRSHHAQALWIKTRLPSAVARNHIYAIPLSRGVKACQG